uniref:basic salivary proline-rich protein 1-like n=1 Tax=Lonchura striata TaxID=40157 RepID=UPI000B4DB593|nr:basic salivary proline-rich protein 1-like [Lonchura striata domestica]
MGALAPPTRPSPIGRGPQEGDVERKGGRRGGGGATAEEKCPYKQRAPPPSRLPRRPIGCDTGAPANWRAGPRRRHDEKPTHAANWPCPPPARPRPPLWGALLWNVYIAAAARASGCPRQPPHRPRAPPPTASAAGVAGGTWRRGSVPGAARRCLLSPTPSLPGWRRPTWGGSVTRAGGEHTAHAHTGSRTRPAHSHTLTLTHARTEEEEGGDRGRCAPRGAAPSAAAANGVPGRGRGHRGNGPRPPPAHTHSVTRLPPRPLPPPSRASRRRDPQRARASLPSTPPAAFPSGSRPAAGPALGKRSP